jgi:HK97 family phage prohead protease
MSDGEIVYRSAEIRAADLADNGEVNLLCSTDAAVNVGEYREILVHTREGVDLESCRSLLLNHDSDQIIGGVRSTEIANGEMRAKVFISEHAKTSTGVPVRELVKTGALRGVSIGYVRDMSSATYDERSNTMTVPKWAVREITLTPTPADTRAKVVRSLPESFIQSKRTTDSDCASNNAAPAAIPKGSPMADEKKAQENISPEAAKNDEAVRAAAMVEARERQADMKKITELAESHGLRASEFIDQPIAKALESMLVAKAKSEAAKAEVKASPAGNRAANVEVGKSQIEKASEESEKALAEGASILAIARRHAQAAGMDAIGMNRQDLAAYVLAKDVPGMSKRSGPANVTSSMFNTVVLANYMDKQIFNGFNNFAKTVTYPIWTRRRTVADFKTFAAGALDSGNLVSTAENLALPELTKGEGSYTDSLSLWGATISLTYQAIVNDDMGEFMNMLNRVGAIAQRTIDKQVYAIVNAATWTNNTDSVTGLATAGDLDTVRKSFEKKTGPSGEIMGNTPKYLLVPSCLRTAALQGTTQVQGSTAMVTHGDLIPVITPHLTEAGSAAQSLFYLAGDPSLVDTVVVSFLQGAETPQTMEYDSGAIAARKWKVILPFVATLASTTVSSTIYIPGMQQGA